MADEIVEIPVVGPSGDAGEGGDTGAGLEQPDIASFVAELDAAPGDGAETPAEGEPAAAGGETAKEPVKPAETTVSETPAEVRARKILVSANRKLAQAAHKERQTRDQIVQGLKTNPLATLRNLGTNIDELLAAGVTEGEAPAAPTTDTKLAELERWKQAQESAQVERQIEAAKAGVVSQIKEAGDKYPRVNKAGSAGHDLAIEVMVAYHAKHGKPLPVDRAAQQVEAYLANLAGESISTPAKPATSNASVTGHQQRRASETLTNGQTRAVTPTGSSLSMDADERYAQVMRELSLN